MRWQSLLLELRGNCHKLHRRHKKSNYTSCCPTSRIGPNTRQLISDVPVAQTVVTLRFLQRQRPTILHPFETPPRKQNKMLLRGTAAEIPSLISSCTQLRCRVVLPLPLCIFMRISGAIPGISSKLQI